MAMSPSVARVCARVQVLLAIGTFPLALLSFLVSIPFGWEIAPIVGVSTLVCAGGLSALGIPVIGLVVSWAWPERNSMDGADGIVED